MISTKIEDVIERFYRGTHPHKICLEEPEEMRLLYETAGLIENGLIVEIGRWYGGSLVLLCLGSPSSKVISIDTCTAYDKPARKLLNEYSIDKSRYLFVEATSQLMTDWNRGPIDLLFIDGCHEEAAVFNDLKVWVPRLKKDGLLIMHDIYCRMKGPKRAIARYLEENKNLSTIKRAKTSVLMRKVL